MKFLENEKNLYVMPVLYLIVIALFYYFFLSDLSATFAVESLIEVITVVLLFTVTLACKKQENNVIKTIMGALLFERVFYAFGSFARMVSDVGTVVATVTGVLYILFYTLFFIVHVSIDIKDTNVQGKLTLNTIIGVLIIINGIVLSACTDIFAIGGIFAFIFSSFTEVVMIIELLTIERKITY